MREEEGLTAVAQALELAPHSKDTCQEEDKATTTRVVDHGSRDVQRKRGADEGEGQTYVEEDDSGRVRIFRRNLEVLEGGHGVAMSWEDLGLLERCDLLRSENRSSRWTWE